MRHNPGHMAKDCKKPKSESSDKKEPCCLEEGERGETDLVQLESNTCR